MFENSKSKRIDRQAKALDSQSKAIDLIVEVQLRTNERLVEIAQYTAKIRDLLGLIMEDQRDVALQIAEDQP